MNKIEGGINLDVIINGYKQCLQSIGKIDVLLHGIKSDRAKVGFAIVEINHLKNSLPREVIYKGE